MTREETKRAMYELAELELIGLLVYRAKLRIMAHTCESEFIATEVRVTEIRTREAEAELVNRRFACEEAGIPVMQHAALSAMWVAAVS